MSRPLAIGELLDAAFRVFRRRFRALAMCVLVVVAPLTVLSTLVQAAAVDGAFEVAADTSSQTRLSAGDAAGSIVANLLTLFAVVLATAACFRTVQGDVAGEDVGWRASLRFAFSRSGALIVALVLYVLAVIVGFLVLIVPGVWLGVAFSLVAPAVLYEGHGATGALKRSFELVKGHWWRVFGALLVMLLLVFVIQFVLGLLLGGLLIAQSSSEAANAVVLTLATIVGYVLVTPLQSALIAFIYFDLRGRKEGFDGWRPEQSGPGWAQGATWPPAGDEPSGPPPADAPSWRAPERPGGFLPPEPPRR